MVNRAAMTTWLMVAMTMLCAVIAYATTSNLLINRAAKSDQDRVILNMQRTIDAWAVERKTLKARFDEDHLQMFKKQKAMDKFTAEVLRLIKPPEVRH